MSDDPARRDAQLHLVRRLRLGLVSAGVVGSLGVAGVVASTGSAGPADPTSPSVSREDDAAQGFGPAPLLQQGFGRSDAGTGGS
jgi:hypothetical protein